MTLYCLLRADIGAVHWSSFQEKDPEDKEQESAEANLYNEYSQEGGQRQEGDRIRTCMCC